MKYIRVTRSDVDGSFTIPLDNFCDVIDAELEGTEIGESMILTIVEMPEEEYVKLPEFMGW